MNTPKNFKDERLTGLIQKIYSEIGQISLALLVISIPIKTFLFHSDSRLESILFLLFNAYFLLRSWQLRLVVPDIASDKKSKSRLLILVTVLLTIGFACYNYLTYQKHYTGIFDVHFLAVIAIFAISIITVLLLSLSFSTYLNKKQTEKLDKELEE